MSEVLFDLPPLFAADPCFEGLPNWFKESANSALEQARKQNPPAAKEETWRFGQVGQIAHLSELTPALNAAHSPTADLKEVCKGVETAAARLVFSNDRLVESSIPDSWREAGVVVAPIAEAIRSHEELVREHFLTQAVRLGTEKFSYLHAAHTRSGVFVYLPEDQSIEGVIEIHHLVEGEKLAIFPHTLIVAGAGSRVEVLEKYTSIGEGEHGVVTMVDLVAQPSSNVRYAAVQNLNAVSRMLQFQTAETAEFAATKALLLQLGSAWSRQQSYSRLRGREARADMLAAIIAGERQSFDSRTLQVHESADATSDLLYKNALFGQARNVFSGLIVVEPGAHQTDAYQTCRNLLNSNEVEAHSMPGLEIHADQVACSHGSTSGQIEDEELFYLLARGIPEAQARHLIARGFLVDVLERYGEGELRFHLEELVDLGLQSV